ncbi:MAG: glycosyltransferase family 2 protein [Bacteroidales bacterium]
MEKAPSVSLLISTYNNTDFLRLCLQSILTQTVKPTEIVIADDGSTSETYQEIKKFRSETDIPVKHIWQEDKGFQLSRIRNIAVAAASGEYIIQIDGDIIMHEAFIEDHLHFALKGALLQGSRVKLGAKYTNKLIKNGLSRISFFTFDISRRENMIRSIALGSFLLKRYRNPYPVHYARGANMSFFKSDFIAVNGYDESFTGWGHEDSDLTLRMMNYGCQKHYAKFCCVAFHLYHKEGTRSNESINKEKMLRHARENKIHCTHGISAHMNEVEKYILI